MKTCIIFFLGILGSQAMASTDPQGYASHGGHSAFHYFYGDLRNNKKNVSCCHDKHCRPTTAQHTNKGWEVKINGQWWTVDTESILPKSAPDGGAHVCAGDPSEQDPLGRVYCVILPPET
jgi:hypothetical protein